METLVLGGTRYFGVHLVNKLLSDGHDITIATRGQTPDDFGNKVKRKIIDRENAESLREAFRNELYNNVIDNIAYCSNDVRHLLDSIRTDRYIMTSTISVYNNFHEGIQETEMDTQKYPLKWCDRTDFSYDEIKRQAECALFQSYPAKSSAAVRFPFVFGRDDYTKRLYFYVEHVVHERAMNIDNLKARLSFINSLEAGNFLAWIVDKPLSGYINASSSGTISLEEIIGYTEKRSGKKALIQDDGEASPLNGVPSFSVDTSIAANAGYEFMNINEWVYPLIDYWVDTFNERKQ